MSEYNDRISIYLDETNTNVWVAFGSVVKIDMPEFTIDDAVMSYVSGGSKKHIPGENYDWSSLKMTISFDPTATDTLTTDALSGTTRRWKFCLRNGKQYSCHAYVKSFKPGSVDGDKSEGTTLDIELQQTGDMTLEAGVAVGGNWYDRVTNLVVNGGDFGLTHPNTKTLVVYAVYSDGNVLVADNSKLTFASSDAAKATVAATGIVSTVAAGPTVIKVSVTGKLTVNASVTCTVS